MVQKATVVYWFMMDLTLALLECNSRSRDRLAYASFSCGFFLDVRYFTSFFGDEIETRSRLC